MKKLYESVTLDEVDDLLTNYYCHNSLGVTTTLIEKDEYHTLEERRDYIYIPVLNINVHEALYSSSDDGIEYTPQLMTYVFRDKETNEIIYEEVDDLRDCICKYFDVSYESYDDLTCDIYVYEEKENYKL
jgi:hypothetical protein